MQTRFAPGYPRLIKSSVVALILLGFCQVGLNSQTLGQEENAPAENPPAENPAEAPDPAEKAPAYRIALVNIERVFAEGKPLQAGLDKIRKEAAAFEDEVKRERGEIVEIANQMKGLDRADEQYRALETRAAELTAKLKVTIELKRNEMLEQEKVLYQKFYHRVRQKISEYSRKHGITLVLKRSAPKDLNSKLTRDEVLKAVNDEILFEEADMDITDDIIKLVQDPLTEERL